MRFFLQMNAHNRDGVLERVLGVVRFRGFELHEMAAHADHDESFLEITLKVDGNRSGENLKRQLEKLNDVAGVDMFTMAGKPASPALSPAYKQRRAMVATA